MPPIEPAGGPERVAPPLPLPPPAAPTAELPVPGRPDAEREPSPETYALSLTQVGLVGRAMIDASQPPAPVRSSAPASLSGAARKVERVLAPYGVAMLPAEAAVEARRRAAEAAEVAARAETAAGRAEDEAQAAEFVADADLADRRAAAADPVPPDRPEGAAEGPPRLAPEAARPTEAPTRPDTPARPTPSRGADPEERSAA